MISIFIPAFNEEKMLREAVMNVVDSARLAGNIPVEIMIVNDGSTDRTAEIGAQLAREVPYIRVINHPTNLGMGACFQTALKECKYGKIALYPGDNCVASYTIQKTLANAHKADLIMGYVVNNEVRTFARYALSMIYAQIFILSFGLRVRAINTVPIFRVDQVRKLKLHGRRYSFCAELNVKLLRSDVTFMEIDSYMNPSANAKSSAFKFKNLFEVMKVYALMLFEVYVSERARFSKRARRVLPF